MDIREFYQTRIDTHTTIIHDKKKRLLLLGFVRLAVFVAMLLVTIFLWGNTPIIVSTLAAGTVLFFVLVSIYTNTKRAQQYHVKLKEINALELRVLDRDLTDRDTGSRYVSELHEFNQDIDLFGEGSLFQWINRTALPGGSDRLAAWLNSNDVTRIEEKQAAIQELSEQTDWRQEYSATAALIDSEIAPRSILHWVKSHKRFVPKFFRWFPYAFSAISIGLIAAYAFDLMSGWFAVGWFFLGVGITGRYLKKITTLYNHTTKIDDLLVQYSKLLQKIESFPFQSQQLKDWQKQIQTESRLASLVLADLSKEVSSLGNRNNMLFGLFGNGLLLWDLRFSYRIEDWVAQFDGPLHEWFEVVEKVDALNTLSNFAFNHPNYVYPTLSNETQFSATALGHPLLDAAKMVTNSFHLQSHDFFIITGANMAGKSTFLRTVAINLVLANSGLPVCAESFVYKPIKLISSMRTSDSLVNDESYFFSELKRLKYIVDRIQEETYFIILDEILKGTNSKDKAEGSQKFVERLVKSNSTGLIATHDLSLCTLADQYSQIKNHYFDAEIVNDELYFDYRFKDGICQNMNASFLLKKMNIV